MSIVLESTQAYPIQWIRRTCQSCGADGKVSLTKAEFKDYLESEYLDPRLIRNTPKGKRMKWALGEYRDWKKTGKIDCPECNGAKTWSEPR